MLLRRALVPAGSKVENNPMHSSQVVEIQRSQVSKSLNADFAKFG
jgi:hypothetical protein